MERYKRKSNTKCFVCSKAIYRRPSVLALSKGRAYCNQTCYGKSCRKETPCIVCGSPILAGAHKKTCNRVCANKNRVGISYKRNRPKDKVKHYRLLKKKMVTERGGRCERCKYENYEILHIHHKDRNRSNNSLKNLELICPNCHAEEHYSK